MAEDAFGSVIVEDITFYPNLSAAPVGTLPADTGFIAGLRSKDDQEQKPMKTKPFAIALLMALSPALHADFSYTETTQITGGAIVGMMKMAGVFSKQARQAGDPIVSTVVIQGNRMVRSNAMRTEIVDLDHETITTIDHSKAVHHHSDASNRCASRSMQPSRRLRSNREQIKSRSPQIQIFFEVKVRNTGGNEGRRWRQRQ